MRRADGAHRKIVVRGLLTLAGFAARGASALKLTDALAAKDSKPVVWVEDFMPGFPAKDPPTLSSLGNFSMDRIYGSPVCAGDASFVSNIEDAPPDFCRYENNMPSMAMEKHLDDDFDEYALERIMLGKWLESPLRCTYDKEECKKKADIVVVPSLVFHMMLQEGFLWDVKHPPVNRARPLAHKYWAAVQERFHKPAAGYMPLIVVHSAFAWDWPGYLVQLHVLLQMSPSFVDRIVLPCTGSNLKDLDVQVFKKAWSDSGFLALQRRAKFRSLGVPTGMGPVIFSLPYPTSLLRETHFVESMGRYNHAKPRRIAVSILASRKRDKYGANWIRGLVMDQFEARVDAQIEESARLVCSKHREDYAQPHCGLGKDPNMWTLTANSAFCVEPAGDTLCRSHLYVAALSGCIPVIIDGGHTQFNGSTWWAWRRPSGDLITSKLLSTEADEVMLDYSQFAVVVQASEIQSGSRNLVQELIDMPEKEPERFADLRRNLDKVAPLFRYSKETCSAYPWSKFKFGCRDAFAAFQQVLGKEVEASKAAAMLAAKDAEAYDAAA